MRLAIMQPYLFPYVGYYGLINAVDKFVFYDDVSFIKNGWINRNRILLNGKPHYLTVPLLAASSHKSICSTQIQPHLTWQRQCFELLRHAYIRAPHFETTLELIKSVFGEEDNSIAAIARKSVMMTSKALSIDTEFVLSSSFYSNHHLSGLDRVIDICIREGASEYINLPGGRHLYQEADFSAHGIQLSFMDVCFTSYPQSSTPFVPGLSVIDPLMSIPKEKCFKLISEQRVIR